MSWWQRLRESRRLTPQIVEPREEVRDPLAAASTELRDWLRAAFNAGEGADRREQEALTRLKADPDRFVAELASVYEQATESDYALRWALVYGAGRLQTPASLDFLGRVLGDPIPPERSQDIHHFSTVAEETTIRCRAAEGVASLAAMGEDRAIENLVALLNHPLLAVRGAAVLALREQPGRPVSDDVIRDRLMPNERDALFSVRRASVEELEAPAPAPAQTKLPRPPGGETGVALDQEAERRRPPRVGN